jgi:cell division protein FtsL
MNNYKEVSFLISSLFVIYFFKDIITTLLILLILSAISLLLMKADYEQANNTNSQEYGKKQETYNREQYNNQNPTVNPQRSSNFVYNR